MFTPAWVLISLAASNVPNDIPEAAIPTAVSPAKTIVARVAVPDLSSCCIERAKSVKPAKVATNTMVPITIIILDSCTFSIISATESAGVSCCPIKITYKSPRTRKVSKGPAINNHPVKVLELMISSVVNFSA